MRGKHRLAKFLGYEGRITPACAGKTRLNFWRRRACQDHPRVCGENHAPSAPERTSRGSPPRVRGKLTPELQDMVGLRIPPRVRGKRKGKLGNVELFRITPACAGKTTTNVDDCLQVGDHPRVCGENLATLSASSLNVGSPPRVRGKRDTFIFNSPKARITPACAGKTD